MFFEATLLGKMRLRSEERREETNLSRQPEELRIRIILLMLWTNDNHPFIILIF